MEEGGIGCYWSVVPRRIVYIQCCQKQDIIHFMRTDPLWTLWVVIFWFKDRISIEILSIQAHHTANSSMILLTFAVVESTTRTESKWKRKFICFVFFWLRPYSRGGSNRKQKNTSTTWPLTTSLNAHTSSSIFLFLYQLY